LPFSRFAVPIGLSVLSSTFPFSKYDGLFLSSVIFSLIQILHALPLSQLADVHHEKERQLFQLNVSCPIPG
jgi:hypothetical protein